MPKCPKHPKAEAVSCVECYCAYRDVAHAAWKIQNHILRNLPIPQDSVKRAYLNDLWTALEHAGFELYT